MTGKQDPLQAFVLFCARNLRGWLVSSLIIFLMVVVVGNVWIQSEIKHLHAEDNADTLLVLGYKVEGEPLAPTNALANRLEMARQYWLESPDTRIVVSGGKTQGLAKSEAEVMRDYLIQHGVRSDVIVMEEISTRTAHQFVNAMQLMDLGNVVVVTNDFHLPRSLMLAERSGLKHVSGLAAPTPTDSRAIFTAYIREPFALLNSWLFDHP
ncbi:YdcF family protein [Wohlfahrtiimonas chitiniclastica]|uniref:YdcF family protein n=1 Tax=Wohlfahrtiimonas chitiniclastica TaxID=400946 RepID=UPI000B991E00|nr:YdcF family protein [Wohlfahrtiimonas chitiniclastica]OYQ74806.1 hypothetical protein B9T18_06105 [Wohlfahrtiimonas chitiniclastica]